MTLFFILALVVLIILMWVGLYSDNVNIMEFVLLSIATIIVFFAFTMYSSSPKAIDVYRGRTILEITYRDEIPVDSVVVFKERR